MILLLCTFEYISSIQFTLQYCLNVRFTSFKSVVMVLKTHKYILQQQPVAQKAYSISKEICTRFCFAVLCCGYTLTDLPISIRLTSLALWQSDDCPIASKATLMNMDKYFIWIHYERLHNHNKAKHNKAVCIFLGIYCISMRGHRHVCTDPFVDDHDQPHLQPLIYF